MPKIALTHLETAIVFALLISVVLGVVTKKTDRDRLQYGLYCFACFVGTIFGLGWLMKLGHG
jgi:hypothetical protein